jgi:hypothetical protein
MRLFDRMRQAQPLANAVEVGASLDRSTTQTPATALLRHATGAAMASVEAHWRLIVETASVGFGALVLSSLFIWATVTNRVSVEAIVVMIVVLILSMITVSQSMRYHARNLSLQERARESVAKTALAAETVDTLTGDLVRIAIAAFAVNLILLMIFLRAVVAPLYLLVVWKAAITTEDLRMACASFAADPSFTCTALATPLLNVIGATASTMVLPFRLSTMGVRVSLCAS